MIKVRKKLCVLMTLIALFCAFGLFYSIAGAETSKTSAFEIEAGASVRFSEPTGLRFVVKLGQQEYENLINPESENTQYIAGKSLGVIIVPHSFLTQQIIEEGDFINAFPVKAEVQIDPRTIYADGEFYFANAVLSNVLYQNLSREFVAIAYILNGETVRYTSAENLIPRSISYIASAALSDSETDLSVEQEKILNKFVQLAIAQKNGAEEEIAISNFENGEYLSVNVAIGTNDLAMKIGESVHMDLSLMPEISLFTKWSSSNPEIAEVDENGNIYAVSEGQAVISAEVYNEKVSCNVEVVFEAKAQYGKFGNEISMKENTGWDLYNGATKEQFSENPEGENFNPTEGPIGSSAEDTYGLLKIKSGTTGVANSAYVSLDGTETIVRNLDAYKDNDRIEITMYYGWNSVRPEMSQSYWDFGVLDKDYNLTGTEGTSDAFKTAHPMPTAQWTVWTVTVGGLRELGIQAAKDATLGFRIQPHKDASRDYCFYEVEVIEGVESGEAVYGELGNEVTIKSGNEVYWEMKNKATAEDFSPNTETIAGNPEEGPEGSLAEDEYSLLKIKTGTTGAANSVYVRLEGTTAIMRNLDSYGENDRVEITMYYGWQTEFTNMNQTYWDFGVLDGNYNLTGTSGTNNAFKNEHPMPTQKWVVWTVTIGELKELGATLSDESAIGFRIQPHKDSSRDICFYSVKVVKA